MGKILQARASMPGSCDIVEKNMVESWKLKVAAMRCGQLSDVMSLYHAIAGCDLNAGIKAHLTEAVDNKMSNAAAFSAVAPMGVAKPQLLVHILNWLTKCDWEKLNCPDATLMGMINVLCNRLNKCGITSLHEQTTKWAVAVIMWCQHQKTQQWMSSHGAYDLVAEFKKSFDVAKKIYPFKYIAVYPEYPCHLDSDAFSYAYPDDDDGPITYGIDGFANIGAYIPLRSTSSLLKKPTNVSGSGRGGGGDAHGMQQCFQQMQEFMQSHMQQSQQQALQQQLGGLHIKYNTANGAQHAGNVPAMLPGSQHVGSGSMMNMLGDAHEPAAGNGRAQFASHSSLLPLGDGLASPAHTPPVHVNGGGSLPGTGPSSQGTKRPLTAEEIEEQAFASLLKNRKLAAAEKALEKAQAKATKPKSSSSLKAKPPPAKVIPIPKAAAKLDWKPVWPDKQPSGKNVFTSYAYKKASNLAQKNGMPECQASALGKAAYAIAVSMWDKRAK